MFLCPSQNKEFHGSFRGRRPSTMAENPRFMKFFISERINFIRLFLSICLGDKDFHTNSSVIAVWRNCGEKRRWKEEEKKFEKSFVIGTDPAWGPSKIVFTNFKVGRWVKNCGKIIDAQVKKGGGVIREGQSAQQLNIIFVILTCFNLTNLFGEEKIRWLPSMKWKFSEAHKFSRHNMYNVQFIYQQFCF